MTRLEELIQEKEQLELSRLELEQKSARIKSLLAAIDRVIEQDKDVEEKPQEKIEYFLFGSGPCEKFAELEWDEFVEWMNTEVDTPYEVYKFVPSETNPAAMMLCVLDGYMGYAVLTKEEYEILVAI